MVGFEMSAGGAASAEDRVVLTAVTGTVQEDLLLLTGEQSDRIASTVMDSGEHDLQEWVHDSPVTKMYSGLTADRGFDENLMEEGDHTEGEICAQCPETAVQAPIIAGAPVSDDAEISSARVRCQGPRTG